MFKHKYVKTAMVMLLAVLMGFFAVYVHALTMEDLTDTPLPSFNVLTDFVNSNRYSQVDEAAPAVNQQELITTNKAISTALGTVYVDESALSFQFETGDHYIWSSTVDYSKTYEDDPNTPENEAKYNLNGVFKDKARSAIIIKSYNLKSPTFAILEETLLDPNTKKVTTFLDDGFESRITFAKSKISLTLKVTFEEDGVKVEVPDDSIDESQGNFRLQTISVYPFFGAVLADHIPGYVFLPDGIGALVRYKKADPTVTGDYVKEIYSRSIGYTTEKNLNNLSSNGTKIYAPVFGFVHGINQNAVFANIEGGAEYGMLNVYYPGKKTFYTTVFPEFIYTKDYKQPIDKAGTTTISIIPDRRNKVNLSVRYSFLSGDKANYIGMAEQYRSTLELKHQNDPAYQGSMVPLKLETIGLEKTTGVLFSKTVQMTTFQEFSNMISELNKSGIENIVGSFTGFTGNGVSWSAPDYRKISSRLGSEADLKALQASLSRLYLETEFQVASSHGGGYNRYLDRAKKINQQLYEYDYATDTKYLLEFAKTKSLFEQSTDKLQDYGIDSLAISSLGDLLYGDYGNEAYLEDGIKTYQDMLQASNMNIALHNANNYLWENMDQFFDFPMYSSQYQPFDDTVPFLSIVLRGKMDLFGSNANFYPYARDELLRLIDFGVYPSFVVTEKSSKYLQKTELEYLYSTRYADLKDAILTYYDFVNKALSHVMNASITDRKVLSTGLVAITYDNGIVIAVNYNNQDSNFNGFTVGAKNYIVTRGNELIGANNERGN